MKNFTSTKGSKDPLIVPMKGIALHEQLTSGFVDRCLYLSCATYKASASSTQPPTQTIRDLCLPYAWCTGRVTIMVTKGVALQEQLTSGFADRCLYLCYCGYFSTSDRKSRHFFLDAYCMYEYGQLLSDYILTACCSW